MADCIDFALQAQSHGLVKLPDNFWDLTTGQRKEVAFNVAANFDRRQKDFMRKYGHLIPRSASLPGPPLRPDGLEPPTIPPVVMMLYRSPKPGDPLALGVNCGLTAETLRTAGWPADAMGVATIDQADELLRGSPAVRFVVVDGFWFSANELATLAKDFPNISFFVRGHSQVAFLQVEPGTIAKMRRVCESAKYRTNLKLAGNSPRFTRWASVAWGADVCYLPNLYPMQQVARTSSPIDEGSIRLASFGAMRLQKHHSVAAAAAVLVARRTGRPVKFHVNSNRNDPGSEVIANSVRGLIQGIDGVTIVECPWQPAPQFRELIASMHCCFQLSSTETFNLVTADAACAGIPSVVGRAIHWAPDNWVADIDDPENAAEVAIRLLGDAEAGKWGRVALEMDQTNSRAIWNEAIEKAVGRC